MQRILKMCNDVISHTQLTLLQMFITWKSVSTSRMGHHQAIVQERESIHVLAQWPDLETSCQAINICEKVSCV